MIAPLFLLLAACDSSPSEQARASTPEPQATACAARRFEGVSFTVCPIDTRRDTVALVVAGADDRPLRSLAALEQSLGARARAVRFATNAGMYDEGGEPIGLFVANGVERHPLNLRSGPGNFHLLPNGVFAIDRLGRMAVTESRRFAKDRHGVRWATQSGPMLVIGGKPHPRFTADGASQLVRNGVGVRDARHAFVVISDEPVSFGRFARLFRDALHCPDALYLDGSVSSLWDPAAGRQDGYPELGPMLVVSRR